MPFSLFLALKYLKPKRSVLSMVTVISVVGVLLGVAILVIVMSVMSGFNVIWKERILSFRPHLTVYSRYGVIRDEEALCEKLEKIDGVIGVAPAIHTIALAHHEGYTSAPFVIGVDPDRAGLLSQVKNKILKGGRFLLDDEHILIGVDEARKLDVRVGSKVLLYSETIMRGMTRDEVYLPEELIVAGIYNLGMQKFDERHILASLDVVRDLVGMEQGAREAYVMTEDPYRFKVMGDRVQQELGFDYIVRNWSEMDSVLFDALKFEKTMMFVLLVFITIVAIFCVTNTLIVITVQKTHEIGLLKALGFPSGKITAAFVWLGLIQCLTGTMLGIGAGVLVLKNMDALVKFLRSLNIPVFPKEIYGLDEIPYQLSWYPDVLAIGITVMVFCTLASLIPAVRAARMDPVEALRSE